MKTVGIAELKSKLSECLGRVRRDHPVTILDCRSPIAKIVPYESPASSLSVRRPSPRSLGARRREVHRAQDARLERTVAIKVLPEHWTAELKK